MKNISVFLVDDHQLILDGLIALFKDYSQIEVVGCNSSSVSAAQEITSRQEEIDVVITDQLMPELTGIELCKRIKNTAPSVRRMLLTMFNYDEIRKKAGDYVHGYVLKTAGIEEIVSAVQEVHKGNSVDVFLSKDQSNPIAHDQTVTRTELQVMYNICVCERTAAETAEILHISIHTVEKHRQNLMTKIDVNRIQGYVNYAHSIGMYNTAYARTISLTDEGKRL